MKNDGSVICVLTHFQIFSFCQVFVVKQNVVNTPKNTFHFYSRKKTIQYLNCIPLNKSITFCLPCLKCVPIKLIKISNNKNPNFGGKMCTEKCKEFSRQFLAFMFSNVGIIVLVIVYTISGAFMFKAIETTMFNNVTSNIDMYRNETVKSLYKITCNINVFGEQDWKSNVTEELRKYQEHIVQAARSGSLPAAKDPRKVWTFSSSFLYSLTVITTIGYGNVTPKSEWGKVITIIYAIIGMPLFLLYLSNIGEILAKSFKWIYARCCLCRGLRKTYRRDPDYEEQTQMQQFNSTVHSNVINDHEIDHQQSRRCEHDSWSLNNPVCIENNGDRRRVEEEEEEDEIGIENEEEEDYNGDYDIQTVTVPVTLCLTIMVGYVCLGAVLFLKWENWSFLDGSYFCFISLSTIGFGDIVPGENFIYSEEIEWSFIFCSMYLMLGMALIAMCFNLMQEEVIHKIRKLMRSIKYCCQCSRNSSRSISPS